MGVTSQAGATREAPVQKEPHPTCAGLPGVNLQEVVAPAQKSCGNANIDFTISSNLYSNDGVPIAIRSHDSGGIQNPRYHYDL
jgi:hypothetical protein